MLAALRAAGHEVYDFRCPHGDPEEKGFNMPDGTLPAMASADCKCEHSSALAHGFKWSYIDENCMDWTPEEYQRQLMHPMAEQQFTNDIEAMKACDTCVLLLPCGRSAHTEAGWFAGRGCKTIAYIPEMQEAELMYKLFSAVTGSLDELVKLLTE